MEDPISFGRIHVAQTERIVRGLLTAVTKPRDSAWTLAKWPEFIPKIDLSDALALYACLPACSSGVRSPPE
jgi:hypothetical protein